MFIFSHICLRPALDKGIHAFLRFLRSLQGPVLLQIASFGLGAVSSIQILLFAAFFARFDAIFDQPSADCTQWPRRTLAAVIFALKGRRGRWDSLKSISGEKRPRFGAKVYQDATKSISPVFQSR